jgi:hypothetical protein
MIKRYNLSPQGAALRKRVQIVIVNDIIYPRTEYHRLTKRSVNVSTGNLENDAASDTVFKILNNVD